MAVLERVMQMKEQGALEPQIIETLQQEGIPPKEINEALSQSKIKSALNAEIPSAMPEQYMQAPKMSQPMQTQMQPSIAPKISQEIQETYEQPQSQEMQKMPVQQMPSQQINSFYQNSAIPYNESAPSLQYQEPTYQEYNEPYQEYQPQQPADIETINDIAEQIAEEKTANLKKEISSFTRFKEEMSLEIERLNDRLSAIENIFNELQVAILGKIGEYGKDIKQIAREMYATQDSFSKILNPLTENIKELKKITEKQSPNEAKPKTTKTKNKPKKAKTRSRKSKKSKQKIEDYVR